MPSFANQFTEARIYFPCYISLFLVFSLIFILRRVLKDLIILLESYRKIFVLNIFTAGF